MLYMSSLAYILFVMMLHYAIADVNSHLLTAPCLLCIVLLLCAMMSWDRFVCNWG